MRNRQVYSQHLQKTGGTAIVDTLRLFFREERIASLGRQLQPKGMSIPDAMMGLRAYDFVMSHNEILGDAPKGAFTFAVFRDPLTRLLSARRQYMQAGDENLAVLPADVVSATMALRDLSLTEILQRASEFPRGLTGSLWNHQTLTLGALPLIRALSRPQKDSDRLYFGFFAFFETGRAMLDWLKDNKGQILDRAKQALCAFSYVGLTEDFDASVNEIFTRIGLPEPSEVVFRNARQPFPDENDPAIRDAAAEFLELDYELYALAQERYDRQRRVARGTPIDYIGRWLATTGPRYIPSRDPPGGHGWYPAHLRVDGAWARWTGPGLESRFATAAEPGRYRMILEVFGAASGRSLYELHVSVEGLSHDISIAQVAGGNYTVTVLFTRECSGRFDILLRFPDIGSEYGLEVKQFTFEPLPTPIGVPAARSQNKPGGYLTVDSTSTQR